MKIRNSTVSTLTMSLCLAVPLLAAHIPPDWAIKDKATVAPFLELVKTKEKYQREKNLPAYMGLLPRHLAATLQNQAKTIHYDDKKMAESLASRALSDAAVAKLKPIAFKQKDVTAALALQESEESAGKIPYRIQSFYLEDAKWKLGETSTFSKKNNEGIDAELGQMVFHSTLPSAPAAIQKVELNGLYDINSVDPGVTIQWSVNGVAQSPIGVRGPASSNSGVVLGGLKKGTNTIQLLVSGASAFSKPINVRIRPETKSIEEYQHTVPYLQFDIPKAGKYTKEFNVTDH